MRVLTGIVVLLGALPLHATGVMAQKRQEAEAEDGAAVLNRLIRTGMIRRAGAREEQQVRAAIRVRGRDATMMPFYVVRKPFKGADALSGGAAVNFLVPWSVTITDYGQSHSGYYRPTGLCLHGVFCPTCPPGTPVPNTGSSLDATKAGCVALPSPVSVRVGMQQVATVVAG